MSAFSENLRQLRKEKGLSLEQLANYIGVSKSSINMYERGEREPSFETTEAIADFFNVNLDFLLGREEQKNNASLPEQEGVVTLTAGAIPIPNVETLLEYFSLLSFSEKQEFLKSALDHIVDSRRDGEQGNE